MHSSQPSPLRFTPRPLILVQRARASSLNSEVENLTRAVEQKALLVKRSLPSLPPSPRSEPHITYFRNGRPLTGHSPIESYPIPLPTPPMTPENSRTFNPPYPRPPSHRRIHLQVAPLSSPLSTDITNSLLFSNDVPLLSSHPPSSIDHAPGRPVPSSELPLVLGLDLLSEFNSSVGENGSRACCKGAHAPSVSFVATEHKQQKPAAQHDIQNFEAFRQLQYVTPPPLHSEIRNSIAVLKPIVPITTQLAADCTAMMNRQTSRTASRRPIALKLDAQPPIFLASTSFTSTDSPSAYTCSPSLRSVRLEHRPPTPPPRKPLPLRPVTRKPPPPIPIELLAQSPTDVSTVAFPSSSSSPIPRVWSTLDSRSLPPLSPSPSSPIPHRTSSSKILSKLEPVIECPFLEGRGRFSSFSSTTGSQSHQRRSTSFEGARHRRPVEFLGMNKSTPDLRLGSSSANERMGKKRDSPRARILSLGLLRRSRTGSKPKLFISSPLSNPPSTTDTPSGLSTLFTSSLPQDSSPSTPSPTTSKRSSSSFRRWANFVAKLFESSSSSPSSPSTITSSPKSLPPTNTNTNATPSAWISVPPSLGKPNKRRLPHGRPFSQSMDNSLRREVAETSVSGFCLPAGVDPGRRPSLP